MVTQFDSTAAKVKSIHLVHYPNPQYNAITNILKTASEQAKNIAVL
jgi:hypothetical protein